jgi:heat shock protein HslJ
MLDANSGGRRMRERRERGGRGAGWRCAAAALALAAPAAAATDARAPGWDELASATYRGIGDEPVTLREGVFEGEPFAPGGAARPRVALAPGFHLTGDLDGDGAPEAVVLLSESAGGSGTRVYLALVARRGGSLANTGTAFLGDRVQVADAAIAGGRIELSVVQAGADDAACCPSHKATRVFAPGAAGLVEVETRPAGRLSLADLGGADWVLSHFDRNDPAPAEPEVTLRLEGEQLVGSSGCNRYFGRARAGEAPGDLEVGPVGGTRMACPEAVMRVEQRYLAALAGVSKFGFLAGRLALTWSADGAMHTLLFERRAPEAGAASGET